MAAADTARMIAELVLKDKLSAGLKTATKNLSKFDSHVGSVGAGAGKLGAGMARAGTLIAGAAVTGLGAAAKAAIDWEDAFQGVVKTVDEADLTKAGMSFDGLEKSLRDMATTIPVTAGELAIIAENAGALGIKAKDIVAFTDTVAKLSVTTNVSADDASTALGQLSNVIGLAGEDFDNFGAALVDLGNKGASTEADILEITRRSGGAANNLDIAADATLGWAAAAANLGINQELAGTSLQRFFQQSQNLVASPGGLKDMAKVAGMTGKDFKKAFEKDASGALESFLAGLGDMPKDARLKTVQSLFGKGTGLTRLILGLSDSVDQNLAPSLDTASEAWRENTALSEEAAKRFATVKSSIQILRNNIIEAAITLGEGFAPALGRAAARLSEFLKQDGNKSRLKALGEDIGKAIDDIDWQEVLTGAEKFAGMLKIALDYAKKMFDIVNALPTEIKAAGLGFIGLDKLSGGLISQGVGGIVGGLGSALAKSLAASIPIFGKAFVQPVFVTNMVPGGLGGGLPGGAAAAAGGIPGWSASAGAGGGLMGLAKGLPIIGLAIAGAELGRAAGHGLIDAAKPLMDSVFPKTPQGENAQGALSGVLNTFTDLFSGNPLGALDRLPGIAEDIGQLVGLIPQTDATTAAKLAALKDQANRTKDDTVAATNKVKIAAAETARETARGSGIVSRATSDGASRVASAVRNNRPIITTNVKVNVSAAGVSKSVTEQARYGPGNGSQGGGSGHAKGTGPLP